ncbi:hypothetical protein [Arcobacter sp. YIC-310]|uniref:hypothetical protein n=1 Tax=Arcobacter sp. YIC-310 TaxID=3376632 RepID=UPI003C28E675
MNWEFISKFGKNKLIKSSTVWVIIVPIFLKITPEIEKMFQLTLTLPFSWELFYYASIFFMIGTFIFQYYCPKIIYENNSYADFNTKGVGIYRLLDYSKGKTEVESEIEVAIENKDVINEKEIFSKILNESLEDKSLSRKFIVFFYSIGILLFSIVFLQNIITVVLYTVENFKIMN